MFEKEIEGLCGSDFQTEVDLVQANGTCDLVFVMQREWRLVKRPAECFWIHMGARSQSVCICEEPSSIFKTHSTNLSWDNRLAITLRRAFAPLLPTHMLLPEVIYGILLAHAPV